MLWQETSVDLNSNGTNVAIDGLWFEQQLIQTKKPLPAPHSACYELYSDEDGPAPGERFRDMLSNRNRYFYLHWPAELCLPGFKYGLDVEDDRTPSFNDAFLLIAPSAISKRIV